MPARELVVLGTASQVPTRTRNHNGHLLRWDGAGLLLDPGEGTQRQMTLAGVAASSVHAIAITHLHGDHTLGLPGVLARMALDGVARPVLLCVPEAAVSQVGHLVAASGVGASLDLHLVPAPAGGGVLGEVGGARLEAVPLDHRVPAVGYRLVEPDGRRVLPAAAAARGVVGPDVGRLVRAGRLDGPRGAVGLEEVSTPRPGQRFALVEDTRWCDGAQELATGADLLLCEATFSDDDAALAAPYGHLTARQAGRLAALGGARRLVITHFSQRYGDLSPLLSQAREEHDDVVLAVDLHRVDVPARRETADGPADGRADGREALA